MNDPKRLLLGDASARERALLSAGAREEPPPDGAARLAAALGLPRDTQVGNGGPEAAPAPPVTASVGLSAGAKWLALAGAAVAAVSSIVLLTSQPARDAQRPMQQLPAASPSSAADSETENENDREVRVPESGSRADVATASAESGSIAGEIAQLEQVRALWRAHESEQALDALRRYEARYKRGALREEAQFMRIELLVQAQRGPEARARAAEFLRQHPEGVHSERVRALAEQLSAR